MIRKSAVAAIAIPAATVVAQGIEVRPQLPKWHPVFPGEQVPIQVWAVGLPSVGTSIPWTTTPGTGQAGTYQGFASAIFNVHASTGAWSNPMVSIPPFIGSPFGNHGVVSGPNVHNINAGVGFNPRSRATVSCCGAGLGPRRWSSRPLGWSKFPRRSCQWRCRRSPALRSNSWCSLGRYS